MENHSLIDEEWKSLDEPKGFLVSNKGRIIGRSGKILKPIDSKTGYYTFGYKEGKKSKHYTYHRAVAKTFIFNPDPDKFTQVNHKNGNKHDNRVENLEWVTPKQNSEHAFRNGLTLYYKPSKEEVKELRKDFIDGLSLEKLTEKYHIQPCTIYKYTNGLNRTAISEEIKTKIRDEYEKGKEILELASLFNLERTTIRKIVKTTSRYKRKADRFKQSKKEVKEMKELYLSGCSVYELAEMYNISTQKAHARLYSLRKELGDV